MPPVQEQRKQLMTDEAEALDQSEKSVRFKQHFPGVVTVSCNSSIVVI